MRLLLSEVVDMGLSEGSCDFSEGKGTAFEVKSEEFGAGMPLKKHTYVFERT